MKAVLISIRPEWVHKILNGEKTIEVRKTVPKIPTPFKCYIYCTKGGKEPLCYMDYCGYDMADFREDFLANGKVVAEFVCDYIFSITVEANIHDELPGSPVETWLEWEEAPDEYQTDKSIEKASCLTINEIDKYIGNSECCYCWHISDIVIYEKPKELLEFKPWKRDCFYSDLGFAIPNCWECHTCKVERPPQSWCYVEG